MKLCLFTVSILLSVNLHAQCTDPSFFADSCDFDNDGIININDIDDDNDGITDIAEGACISISLDLINDPNSVSLSGFKTSNEIDYTQLQTPPGNPSPLAPEVFMNGFDSLAGRGTFDYDYTTPPIINIDANGMLNLTFYQYINIANTTGAYVGTDRNIKILTDQGELSDTWVISPADVAVLDTGGWVMRTFSFPVMPNTPLQIMSLSIDMEAINGGGGSFSPTSSEVYALAIMPFIGCSGFLDTDNDNIPNHLDLDSDGDGCYDSYEAGVPGATNDQSVTDSIAAAPYGGNGLSDALQGTDTNTTNYSSSYNPVALSTALNRCLDTDNDGISDLDDIDDDNDGILDAAESPNCFYSLEEATTIVDLSSDLNIESTARPFTNAYDGVDEISSYTGLSPNQSSVGLSVYEITLAIPTTVSSIDFSMYNLAMTNGAANTMKMQGFVNGVWEDLDLPANRTVVNGIETFTNTLHPNTVYSKLRITGANGIAYYGRVREIYLRSENYVASQNTKPACSDDLDGDGIFNHLDLDSDGDGCYDSYEAGVPGATNDQSVTDSIAAAPYGGNGLSDALQDTDTNTTNYSSSYSPVALSATLNICLDTDNDGILDLDDIDDDNDGILDAVESPNCFYTEAEATMVIDVSSDLNIESTARPFTNAYDGVDATTSFTGLSPNQSSVGLSVYEITLAIPTTVSSIDFSMYNLAMTNGAANTMKMQGFVNGVWEDLDLPANRTVVNGIETFTNTLHPNTVYSKLRITGATGIAYYGRVREIYLRSENYVASQNTKPACSDDVDGDGIFNHLDLDSDGDGCYDSYEAGVPGATNDQSVTDSIAAAPYGGNGLSDALQGTDTNTTNYSSSYNPVALSTALNRCLDTDNDGISDLDDIDDDNDGILDAAESPNCFYSLEEATTIVDLSSDLNIESTARPFTNAYDGVDEISSYTGLSPNQSSVGLSVYEITLAIPTTISSIDFSMYNLAMTNGAANTMKMQGFLNGIWEDLDLPANRTVVNGIETFTNTLHPNTVYSKLRITGATGVAYYGRVREIYLRLENYVASQNTKPACSDDLDGDGIFNHLDLDSDGDGCYDSYEAGVPGATNDQSVTDSIAAAPYGGNGLSDALQDTDTNTTNYSSSYNPVALSAALNRCLDTDNDGISDLDDIDDDNDGILDAAESPNCFYTEAEATMVIDVSSDLNIESTARPFTNAYDGVDEISSYTGLLPNQNSVDLSVYEITLAIPTTVSSIDFSMYNLAMTNGAANTMKMQGFLNGIWEDLDLPANRTVVNGIETFTNTLHPNTVYSKLRITGATGVAYYGRVREIYLRLENYVASQNTKPACSDDLDGDGISNHLDLDSDGDGCYDSYEAGVTGATNNQSVTDSIAAAPYGGNGLSDALQDTDTNRTNYSSSYNPVALSTALNRCLDTDNDGISDLDDIDDDNDGILDVAESPNCFYTETEATTIIDVSSNLNIESTARPFTNAYDGIDEISSYTGLLPNQNSVDLSVYEITLAIPTTVSSIDFSMYNLAMTNGAANTMKMQGFLNGVWEDLDLPANRTVINGIETFTNTLHPNTVYSKLRITGATGVAYYGRVREIYLRLENYVVSQNTKPACSDDLDGDGISNHLDLDSDGDGCYDSYEAGVPGATNNQSVTDSIAAAPYGGNGLSDALQDTDTNTTNYSSSYSPVALSATLNICLDTDNDGILDLDDIDDDNDGILDAVESPNCFYSLEEATAILDLSSDLNIESTARPLANAYDGVDATTSFTGLSPNQSSVGLSVYEITLAIPTTVSSIDFSMYNLAMTNGAANTMKMQGFLNGVWEDLDLPANRTVVNGIETFTNTLHPNTVYSKLRITGANGIAYYGRVREIYLRSENYVASQNTKPACSDDLDGDGIFNHLDLDSDGDGCYDSYEAGVPGATNDQSVTDSITAAPYGGNGLSDTLQGTDTNTTNYSSSYNPVALSTALNRCLDTDNDGISDLDDIDDDNDGILDVVEGHTCENIELGADGTFESLSGVASSGAGSGNTFNGNITGGGWQNVSFTVDSWMTPVPTDGTSGSYEGLADGTPPSPNGGVFVAAIKGESFKTTVNSLVIGHTYILSFYQVFSGNEGESIPNITSGFWNVTFGGVNQKSPTIIYQGESMQVWEEVFIFFTANSTSMDLLFEAGSIETDADFVYMGVDGVRLRSLNSDSCSLDTDGDGIPNHLDLDSDGDGCYDSYEAGVTGSTNNASATDSTAIGPYGTNGLANSLEDKDTTNAQTNYISSYDSLALDNSVYNCTRLLPIELLYFDARATQRSTVDLEWVTSTEINNDYFTIERSIDAEKWELLENINGMGNSNQIIKYKAIDDAPYGGISYYRLKQTDFDGEYSYSSIQVVEFGHEINKNVVKIYPNPADNELIIVGVSDFDAVYLLNIQGQHIEYFVSSKKENSLTIDISNLNSGIYFVKIKGNKVIKLFKK